MINIMVVDDHQLLIDGIKSTLEEQDGVQVVAEANNGEEALQRLETVDVDVVLMDINMPVMDGIQCTRHLKKRFPDVQVIALSQYPEKRFVKTMLKHGASGYLLKDAAKSELILAIQKVVAGEQYVNERLYKNFTFYTPKAEKGPLFPQLTARELEIVRLICSELSTQEIADRLHLSTHTIETHRRNIMNKVGVKNTAGLVKWAVENEFV